MLIKFDFPINQLIKTNCIYIYKEKELLIYLIILNKKKIERKTDRN